MYLNLLFLPLLAFLFIILLSRYVDRYTIILINILTMVLTIIFSLICFYEVVLCNCPTIIIIGPWITIGEFELYWQFLFDSLSITMVVLVLLISTFVHFYSWEYMGGDPHFLRFISYLSIFSFFMLFFVTAGTFLQMFFGWEGVGLSSYLLINFWYTRLQANKSAMKAIIVNRISDLRLYFSIFILLYLFGTLDYLVIFNIVHITNISLLWLNIICFFIFIGAVGKSAQLGLHTWLPDAMEGPTPVSALLHAATMVTAGVFLLIRCSFLLEFAPDIMLLIMFIGGCTTFIAGTIGAFQNDIKKVIAYPTCSQLGYMFLILGVYQYNVSFFHLFNHAFFKALLFLGAGSVIHAVVDEQDIRKMGGLFYFLPVTYISFFIGSIALAGIPYLSGFYSKDLLIELTFFKFELSTVFVYWLALCSVFFTSFYSTRLAYYVFFGWPNYLSFKIFESGNIILFVLSSLTVLSIFVGFIMKDLFVGAGTAIWDNSINLAVLENHFFETELGFVFGSTYYFNKLYPLIITILALAVALVFINNWRFIINSVQFRKFYEFINQKWYFDFIYLQFIIKPVINFAYNISFKLIDRGILEFFGSTSVYKNLIKLVDNYNNIFDAGNLYKYIVIQVIILLSFVLWLLIL